MPSQLLLSLAAGALLGLAGASLLLLNGRVSGVSGILAGAVLPSARDGYWRLAFLAGLVAGGLALLAVFPDAFPSDYSRSLPVLALAGVLVGLGSRLGGGCTSGHGVCGMGRMSPRSIAATLTFMATGAIAVAAVTRLFGGAL